MNPLVKNAILSKSSMILFFIFFSFFSSCSSRKNPEEVLRNYVNYRFSGHQDKDYILKQTTGPLYDSINLQNDEDFEKFCMDVKNYRKKKFSINIQECSETHCSITYVIKYNVIKDKIKAYSIDVKKIAELELEDNKWKISDVSNIKTYIDSKQQIPSKN